MPVEDEDLIRQLNEKALGKGGVDPMTEQALNEKALKGNKLLPVAKDIGYQAARGVGKGLTEGITSFYRLPDWIGEKTGAFDLPNVEETGAYRALTEYDDPETTAGAYAGRIGEFVGGSLGVGSPLYGLGRAGVAGLRGLGRMTPRQLAVAEGASSVVGGGAAQTAEEMGGGPVAQGVAGVAGALGGPAAFRAFRGLGEEGALHLFPPQRPPAAPLGAPATPQTTDDAMQGIADWLTARGRSPQQIADEFQSGSAAHQFHQSGMTPRAEVLADIDELSRLAASNVRHTPAAAAQARPFMTARQTGIGQEGQFPGLQTYPPGDPRLLGRSGIDAPPAGQHSRMIEGGRRILGIQDMKHHGFEGTAELTAQKISASQKAAADVSYGNVREIGKAVDLRAEPAVADAIEAVKARLAQSPPGDEATVLEYLLRQYAPSGQVHSYIDDFDKAKRLVDARINKLYKGSDMNPAMGRVLDKHNDDIVAAMNKVETEDLGNVYRAAREEFAGPAKIEREIQLGHDYYHGKSSLADIQKLDKAGQKRARLGFHGAFEEKIGDQPITHDLVKKTLATRNQMQRWRDMIGDEADLRSRLMAPDAHRRWEEYMTRVAREKETDRIVSGGSPTAENIAVDQAMDVLHGVRDIFQGNLGAVAQRFSQYVLNKLFGQRAEVAAEQTRLLFSADPAENARTIARLQMLLGRTRFQRYSEMMAQHAATRGGYGQQQQDLFAAE